MLKAELVSLAHFEYFRRIKIAAIIKLTRDSQSFAGSDL